jgi:hypothetical protein
MDGNVKFREPVRASGQEMHSKEIDLANAKLHPDIWHEGDAADAGH